jgi:hypothetical protein
MPVDDSNTLFIEKAAADAALIGDKDDRPAGFIPLANGIRGPRPQRDLIATREVTDVINDGAIAVEKDRRPSHG